MITFTWSSAASYTTVVFFPSPGISFDFASFNFHVPIFGSSAAKHATPAKKQSARVNSIVLIFMHPSSTGFQLPSMFLFKPTNGPEKTSPLCGSVISNCFSGVERGSIAAHIVGAHFAVGDHAGDGGLETLRHLVFLEPVEHQFHR